MTGGLAFEALNHNGFLDKNLLLIYNDNGMSIDPNVGALSKLLTRIASSRLYNIFREESLEIAERAPFSETLGLKRTLQMMHDSMKAFSSRRECFSNSWDGATWAPSTATASKI